MLETVDHLYIALICVILLVMCCSRNICDGVRTCLGDIGICVSANCCFTCDCLDYHEKLTARDVVGSAILLICYTQPFTLLMVRIAVEYLSPDKYQSTVVLFDYSPALNTSDIEIFHSQVLHVMGEVSVLRVDMFIPALVFAAGVCMSSMAFRAWKNDDTRDGEQEWDCSLAESETWCTYELAYCSEVFYMNAYFILASCSQCSAVQAFYATLSLSLVMCYFVCSARHTRESAAEQFIAMISTLLLIAVLAVMWTRMVETTCTLSVVAAGVHALCIFWVVAGHAISAGRRSAQAVCLTRFVVSIITCVFCLTVLALGRDQFCTRTGV